ncbi:uncharacterized protein ColSpa_03811 [Colletotrichum spaethianum]|uniref:Uncharacterized protein n=1 Tax=Colletotrichum spaethianum TaxID=700344 RepID=A0AA37LCV0_9PEZI|nr:uncharacterized protein ColSpa_03811 [Colletotrichum spaethianum]GKT43630.1 hypothetical protein ColSpa_03811 [Colletotrichum spaethianum]
MFVGNQFSDCNVEAELNCLAQTIHRGADNEGLNVTRDSTKDDTDDGNDVASNKEPASAKEI